MSYSRLSNLEACELMHVLGDELGLGKPGGYHAWVGKTVHRIVEDAERGVIAKDPPSLVAALKDRWRPQEFPSKAVSTAFFRLAHDHMLRNWFDNYADKPATGIERFFEFEFEGALVIGYIDRIGPAVQEGSVITDFKTGKSDNAGPPRDSLQLGIYYLAVQESESLAEFQPVRTVELAFLRGNWRNADIDYRKWQITDRDEDQYQAQMRERLAELITRKKQLNEAEVYRPNPYANCRFCDFQTLVSALSRGPAGVPGRVGPAGSRGMSTRPTGIPPEIVTAMGALPTDEQWAAISMPLKPYVLVAGAGSGKTSVMAARVVFLALAALDRIQVSDDPGDDAGVLPGNVLCLTFTVKATENLRSRVRRALAGIELPEGEEPEILNYHAMAAQVLERHGILAGIEAGRRVLSQAQRVELAGRVLDEMEFVHTKTEWQPSVVDKILNLDSQIANHLLDPDEVVAFVEERLPVYKKIARTDRVYYSALERIELAKASVIFRRLKRELGVIDFSDQIELAMQIAAAHPEVGREYRDRFGAVLLDEYQDTNVAQARLMQALFGDGHPVTAVGDPDQNIYAWRGASLYNLLEFPTAFRDARRWRGGPAAAVHQLPERRPHPARRRCHHRTAARGTAARPRQAPRAVRAQRRRARSRSRRTATSSPRRGGSPSRSAPCTTAARRGRRRRCCAGPRGCSSCCSRRSPNETSPPRSWGSPASCGCRKWSRSSRTRVRRTTPPPRSRWPACS